MSLARTRSSATEKWARLKRWGDTNENKGDGIDEDADFGDDCGDGFGDDFVGARSDFMALNDTNCEIVAPTDDLQTIKVAPAILGISPALNVEDQENGSDNGRPQDLGGKKGGALKKGPQSRILDRFVEHDDFGIDFGNDNQNGSGDNAMSMSMSLGEHVPVETPQPSRNTFLLPGTASILSPIRRRSLSEFSEDTDTDITEINDKDFEEIDDVFGKKESEIYSSGRTGASKKSLGSVGSLASLGLGRAQEVLLRRKQKFEEQARAEDDELCRRYKNRTLRGKNGGVPLDHITEEVNTLKLKDLRLYGLPSKHQHQNQQELVANDVTINYEYTKDDFESFEDGFVGDLPSVIRQDKLSHFHIKTEHSGGQILHKASMPVFPRSLKASRPTKFKSTMDLAETLGGEKQSEHPLFNDNNKIIRKLDMMPSFHIKKPQTAPAPLSEDMLDYNMELHKKQLLEKYMEISEKQFQLRSSPRKKSATNKHHNWPSKNGVGLVKYLNNEKVASFMPANKQMKFNLDCKTWEGNEHDLMRFDEHRDDGVSQKRQQKQPSLITLDQFRHQKEAPKGNMVYDPENLRWVNKDALDEEEENVFDDLPDLIPNDIPQYSLSKTASAQSLPARADRGVSTFTQRTVLTASNGSTVVNSGSAGEEFALSSKLMSKFEKEEAKIRKKTHHWFGPNESHHLNKYSLFDAEYFWEIRKMVMGNDA